MSLTCLRFIAFVAYTVFATVLTGVESPIIRISLPSIGSNITSSSRFVTPDRVPIESALNVECAGAQYGFNLNVAECKDAKRYIGSSSEQFPWVERHTRHLKPHFFLPYRYMGDYGRCYIQIGLAQGYSLSYASLYEVQNAANAIISKCDVGDKLQGGTVTNIGADGGLTMVLSTYQKAVECRGTFEPRMSCASILDDMEATQAIEVFGPQSDPATTVGLPAVVEARDAKSSLRVLGTSDTTSWYQVWEAAMLVYSVCARGGKGGIVKELGDHGKLFLTMTARTGSLSNHTGIAVA